MSIQLDGTLACGDRTLQRLQPVLAADRFWSDLAQDSYAGNAGATQSHADLRGITRAIRDRADVE